MLEKVHLKLVNFMDQAMLWFEPHKTNNLQITNNVSQDLSTVTLF